MIGSCSGNPGPGGYGVIVLDQSNTLHFLLSHQCESNTTNNREELKALIEAIDYAINDKENEFTIYCDSSYCVNIATNWIYSWAKNNWTNSKKQTVENVDLIQELYKKLTGDQTNFPNYTIEKIPGHNGIIGNELADAAATNNWTKFKKIFKENNINTNDLTMLRNFDII